MKRGFVFHERRTEMESRPEFKAPCPFCDRLEGCDGTPCAADTAGFIPRREVDLEKISEYWHGLRKEMPASLQGAVERMERELLRHLEKWQPSYQGMLEFSVSRDDSGDSAYRFSYSFPMYNPENRREVNRDILKIFEPFGPEAQRFCARVLTLATPPLVTQPLLGFDARGPTPRFKLYLQFDRGREEEKERLLSLLGPALTGGRGTGDLHLLGLDFHAGGEATAAKLYEAPDPVFSADHPEWRELPGGKLLFERPVWKDFLFIRRRTPLANDRTPPYDEIDFGLRANSLTLKDLLGYDSDLDRLMAGLSASGRPHRMAMTRISLAFSGKINVYYLILDPPRSP